MTFFEEMAQVVVDLLGPGEDSFGEEITFERAAAGYNPSTMRATTVAPRRMTTYGTADADLLPVSTENTLTARYERVLYAVPKVGGLSFVPGQNDRVTLEARRWQVMETGHVVKQGIPLLWICGLAAA